MVGGSLTGVTEAADFGAGFTGPVATSWAPVLQKSFNRLIDKYRSHDFSGGTFLAELPSTATMVAESGLAIFSAYKNCRRGRFSKAVQTLREINLRRGRRFGIDKHASSNWLALQFGWLPLISDAYDSVSAFSNAYEDGSTIRLRSSAHIKTPSGGNNAAVLQQAIDSYRVRHVLVTSYVPTRWEQFGLTDPVSIAWELVPFSFIADYFISIGDWLQSNAVLPKAQSLYITSLRFKQKLTGIKSDLRPAFPFIATVPPAPLYNGLYINVNRQITRDPVIPPPFVRINTNWTKIANMVAVADQLR
jgi:hypothetical protein